MRRAFVRGAPFNKTLAITGMPSPETQRDYFAELYVAGIFGDAGWSVYFPKRDVGFDFVVSKTIREAIVLRPVQVKGFYPTAAKLNKMTYGYQGKLTAVTEPRGQRFTL